MSLDAFGGAHNAWHSSGQNGCLDMLPANHPKRLQLAKHLSPWTSCLHGQCVLPGVQVYKGNWRHTDVAVKRFLEQDLSPQLMKVGAVLY